jgi:hypothetical protein
VTPFRDSIDALLYALREIGEGAPHLEILYGTGYLPNGVKYCNVQISCGKTGYSISAYGDEADRLHEAASRNACGRRVVHLAAG